MRAHRHTPLDAVADALVSAFLELMSSRPAAFRAAYMVSAEPDSAPALPAVSERVATAVAGRLASAEEAAFTDLSEVSFAVTGALAGAARALIEHGLEPASVVAQRRQLTLMMRGYLRLAARPG